MNKKRLIKENIVSMVSEDTGHPRSVVETVVNSVLANIMFALSHGQEVQFASFGTFEPKLRAARIGRNPHTKEAVPIPARVVPSFKAGKALKQVVTK